METSYPWRRLTLTRTGPLDYDCVFEHEDAEGRGNFIVEADPDGKPPTSVAVCQSFRAEYGCDVRLLGADDSDLTIYFQAGDKPWVNPRGDSVLRHSANEIDEKPGAGAGA